MRGNILSPESLLSNGVSLLLLMLAIWRPVVARWLFCILFIGAAFFNTYTAIVHPEKYLLYADLTALPMYEQFIRGAFSRHITTYIIAIAIGQLLTGIYIGSSGQLYKAALAGAIIFLLAIAPLGAGSAFPCSIVMAAACMVLLRKGADATLLEIFRGKIRHSGDLSAHGRVNQHS